MLYPLAELLSFPFLFLPASYQASCMIRASDCAVALPAGRLIPYVLYTFGHINYGSWRPKEDYFLSSLPPSRMQT